LIIFGSQLLLEEALLELTASKKTWPRLVFEIFKAFATDSLSIQPEITRKSNEHRFLKYFNLDIKFKLKLFAALLELFAYFFFAPPLRARDLEFWLSESFGPT
jgi:hypothetical protein